jgi:hypothetical protein
MASYYLFIHMNAEEFKFDETLSLGFDLRYLKMNTNYIKRS